MPGRTRFRIAMFAMMTCVLLPAPALAQDDDFCAERPGQTTPPCVLAPGRFMIETAAVNWTKDSTSDARTDTLTFGSSELRIGALPRLEAQLGWTPFGVRRTRFVADGQVVDQTGTGDVTLGLIYGISGTNGPVAVQGFVTVPTGGDALGAGDWGAGLRLPVAFGLGRGIQLALTPEVDASVNSSGSGRHVTYGGAAGIGFPMAKTVSFDADIALFRDEDPDGASTRTTGSMALAWQAGPDLQFDIGAIAGLDDSAPDVGLYVGVAHRF
jgi:hypothetical protein